MSSSCSLADERKLCPNQSALLATGRKGYFLRGKLKRFYSYCFISAEKERPRSPQNPLIGSLIGFSKKPPYQTEEKSAVMSWPI